MHKGELWRVSHGPANFVAYGGESGVLAAHKKRQTTESLLMEMRAVLYGQSQQGGKRRHSASLEPHALTMREQQLLSSVELALASLESHRDHLKGACQIAVIAAKKIVE